MADPLSITLAAITLATALKDVMEIAMKLKDSLSKPGHNMRAAEALAAETLEIVQDLNKFCEGHEGTLNDAPGLKEAVTTLLRDMQTVYTKCLPILETRDLSATKFHKIKVTINSWKNRKVIERDINALKDQANKCYRRFTMFTQLDTAAGIVQLRGTLVQGRAPAPLQHSPPRVSDDNVLAFVGSTPVVLSTLPPHIKLSEELIFKSHVAIQVRRIDTAFKQLSLSESYIMEPPDSSHLHPFRVLMRLTPYTKEDTEDLQHCVCTLIGKIQKSLQQRHNRLSIQKGANAMSKLSDWLRKLGMSQESLTLALDAADLYRILSKTNEDVYLPHLAHTLRNLYGSYLESKDLVNAYKVITEAVTLARRVRSAAPTFEAEIQVATLISHSAFIARVIGDSKHALQDAEESVQILERLIGKAAILTGAEGSGVEWLLEPTCMTYKATNLSYLAGALTELHHCLFSTTRKEESMDAGVKAIQLFNRLAQVSNDAFFDQKIATLSFSLTSEGFSNIISSAQALSYAQQSVYHYEKTLQKTGIVPENLFAALGNEAKLLSSMKRFDEAYAVCQKTETMLRDPINNQRLRAETLVNLTSNYLAANRFAEAGMIGAQVLTTHRSSLLPEELCLVMIQASGACLSMRDYCKSVQLAEGLVNYWRILAFQDNRYTQYLANSLSVLGYVLMLAQYYERAFNDLHEAMKLYSCIIIEYPDTIQYYMGTLELNITLARVANMKEKSLDRSRDVVRYGRALVKQFPDEVNSFIRHIRDHAFLLESFDHLTDSNDALEEALTWFGDNPTKDIEFAKLHTDCLVAAARCLCLRGHLDQSCSFYDGAIEIGRSFIDDHSVAVNVFKARRAKSCIFYLKGQIPLALVEVEQGFEDAAKYNLEKDPEYVWLLEVASFIYRSSERVDDALTIVRKLIALDENPAKIYSWILSDLLADAGEEAEALRIARQAVAETEQCRTSSLTTEKMLHAQAQYSLALRLFSNNELSEARELLSQVRSCYEQYAQGRNSLFVKLAITLWAQGKLECVSNRHEEGIFARAKLNDLRSRLRLVFPSLDNVVEVGLRRERNFVAWRNLCKRHQLTCGHQNDEEQTNEDA